LQEIAAKFRDSSTPWLPVGEQSSIRYRWTGNAVRFCVRTLRSKAVGSVKRWRDLEVFQQKPADFLNAVEAYLVQLDRLSLQQREDLAVFKAAELVNALIQIKERQQADDRVGPDLAQTSFALVRSVIRSRQIPLQGTGSIDLSSPALRELIDEGCRLFHIGKTKPQLYQQALALSAAQCLALNDQLEDALQRYAQGCGFDLPPSLLDDVRQSFIARYRCA
jgi:hypothetical protein